MLLLGFSFGSVQLLLFSNETHKTHSAVKIVTTLQAMQYNSFIVIVILYNLIVPRFSGGRTTFMCWY